MGKNISRHNFAFLILYCTQEGEYIPAIGIQFISERYIPKVNRD